MELITIRTFDQSVDAHLFRIELENAGIECFIHDEQTVTMNPLYSNAIGGIKVKVRKEDLDKVTIYFKEHPVTGIPVCPNCGSTQIEMDKNQWKIAWRWLAVLIALVVEAYPFSRKNGYRCTECGTNFN